MDIATLIPTVATDNISSIAAFSLILKYIIDLVRYVSSEYLNKEITLDPKVLGGIIVFVALLLINRDSIGSIEQVYEYAGTALTLAATTWASHKVLSPRN